MTEIVFETKPRLKEKGIELGFIATEKSQRPMTL